MRTDKFSSPQPEYRKIRDYFMNLIYRSAGQQILIPSTRTVAQQFGVARNTVQRAVNELVADKYLIARQGIGVYTNPARSVVIPAGVPRAIIGLLHGDGRNFIYDSSSWPRLAELGKSLTRRYFRIRFLESQGTGLDALRQNIANSYLDGLIWVAPPRECDGLIHDLIGHGLKVIVCDREIEGIDSVCLDFHREGYEAGTRFVAANRRRLFIGCMAPDEIPQLPGFRDAFIQAGWTWDESLVFQDQENFLSELEAQLKSEIRPDAFFLIGSYLKAIIKLFHKYEIRLPEDCLILAGENSPRYPDFKGIIHIPPFEAMGECAADIMEQKFIHSDVVVKQYLLPIPLKEIF